MSNVRQLKGGERMDFDFNFDLTEFDDEMAELNEAAKNIDLSEFDKELSELNEAAKNINFAEYDKILSENLPN